MYLNTYNKSQYQQNVGFIRGSDIQLPQAKPFDPNLMTGCDLHTPNQLPIQPLTQNYIIQPNYQDNECWGNQTIRFSLQDYNKTESYQQFTKSQDQINWEEFRQKRETEIINNVTDLQKEMFDKYVRKQV